MKSVASLIFLAWLCWIGFYWKLAWQDGSDTGRSYAKLFFPILLFFGNAWPHRTLLPRLKLQLIALVLVIITAIFELIGT